MKILFAFVVTALLLTLFAHAADELEIRGEVAGTINGVSNLVDDSYTWNPQNFPGFYYDPNRDMGTERLTATITRGNDLRGDLPYGIVYTTKAQQSAFKRGEFGFYNIIGLIWSCKETALWLMPRQLTQARIMQMLLTRPTTTRRILVPREVW